MKKYEIYRDLMKEVRGIEKLIVKFQNELRQQVHKKQLVDYKNIGVEIQLNFDDDWSNIFKSHEEKKSHHMELQRNALDQLNELVKQRELVKIGAIKLKQNNKIKLLSNQERLVAINERVEEAANFRNELNIIQRHDEERLLKTKNESIKNLSIRLEKDKQKEIKKKKDRLELEKFNLVIEKNKETDILSKQIGLHVKEIDTIQKFISQMYVDLGKFQFVIFSTL